jgi:hypothetical protein
VNLLGIANFISVAKLAQISKIERNATGDITLITDTTSESRLKALLLNAGWNAKRLRKFLAEDFLIEAAYQVTGVGVLPPEFRCRHTFLEMEDSADRQQMKNLLDVARVLALMTPADEQARLSKQKDFGRVTFYAEVRYPSETIRRVFLDEHGNPRSVAEYETIGRSALGALLAGDEGQEIRLRFTQFDRRGDDLWRRMKETGNVAAFAPLFGLPASTNDPRVAAAGSDYLTIVDWASAMNRAGESIRDVLGLLGGAPVLADDPRFEQAREELKKRISAVVSRTHEHFGDPLGLIMVYLAAGEQGDKVVIATGDKIDRLEAGSPGAAAARA